MTLSPRQSKLIDLIAGGLSVKQAAARIGISPHTARVHMRIVYYKLQARSQSHAVAIWVGKRAVICK